MARRRKVRGETGGASRNAGATASERVLAEIRIARRAAGLTQRELAARLNRSVSWIAGVETGRRNLWVGDLEKIANALGLDVFELLARARRENL